MPHDRDNCHSPVAGGRRLRGHRGGDNVPRTQGASSRGRCAAPDAHDIWSREGILQAAAAHGAPLAHCRRLVHTFGFEEEVGGHTAAAPRLKPAGPPDPAVSFAPHVDLLK